MTPTVLLASPPAIPGRPSGQGRRRTQRALSRLARAKVCSVAAFGSGEFLARLAGAGIDSGCKAQPLVALGGFCGEGRLCVELGSDTVTCPAGEDVSVRRDDSGDATAYFAQACAGCPLRSDCSTAAGGRTIVVARHEVLLGEACVQAADPRWAEDYGATRRKVEREPVHAMRRSHQPGPYRCARRARRHMGSRMIAERDQTTPRRWLFSLSTRPATAVTD